MVIELEAYSEYKFPKKNKYPNDVGKMRKGIAQPHTNDEGTILNSSGSINQGVNASLKSSGAQASGSVGESLEESKFNEIDQVKNEITQSLGDLTKTLKFLETNYQDSESRKSIAEVKEDIIELELILNLFENNRFKEGVEAYDDYLK